METRSASLIQSRYYDSYFFAKNHEPTQAINEKVNYSQIENVQKLRGYLIVLKDLCEQVLAKQQKKIFTKELFTEKDIFTQHKYYEFCDFSNVINQLIYKTCKEEIKSNLEAFRKIQSHSFLRQKFPHYYSSYSFSYSEPLDKNENKTRKIVEFLVDYISHHLSDFPLYKSLTYYIAKKRQPIIPEEDFEESYIIRDWAPTYYSPIQEKKQDQSVVSVYLNKLSNWNPFKKSKSNQVDPSELNFAKRKRLFPLY